MWQRLGKQGLIVNGSWPDSGDIDLNLSQQFGYIEHSAHSIRQSLNKNETQRKKKIAKSGKDLPVPDSMHLFVTEEYTQWQQDTLLALRSLHKAGQESHPDDYEWFASSFRTGLMKTPPLAGKY